MKRRKKTLLAVLFLLFAVAIGFLFRPYPTIDQSKVHPSLRGLDDSTECVWTSIADGGTLLLSVTRPDGTEVFLAISNSYDDSFTDRGQLFIGSFAALPDGTKIVGFDHTKFVVAELLAKDAALNPSLHEDIAIMTKRLPDWISLIFAVGLEDGIEALRINH